MKTKHGTTNYKALRPFIAAVNSNGGWLHFTSGGYMDLVIENLGYSDYRGKPVYSIAHYGEQYGDLMADPEVTIAIDDEAGTIRPLSYRNDYMGKYDEIFKVKNGQNVYSPRLLTDIDEFLYFWRKNIEDQGFSPSVYKNHHA